MKAALACQRVGGCATQAARSVVCAAYLFFFAGLLFFAELPESLLELLPDVLVLLVAGFSELLELDALLVPLSLEPLSLLAEAVSEPLSCVADAPLELAAGFLWP